MASPSTWLELLSWLKAAYDVISTGADLYEAYRKHKAEKDTAREAARISSVFSTYSEEEIEALVERIKGCMERFIQQGGGADRVRCICSVLNEIRVGNGGVLPEIDDWQRIYAQLNCGLTAGRG